MNSILALVLSMSVTASVLIALLMLTEKLTGSRVSRRWQYYIWLLVIARLLIPFGPDTTMLTSAYSALSGRAVLSEPAAPAAGELASLEDPLPELEHIPLRDMQQSAASTVAAPKDSGAASGGAVLLNSLWIVWAAVAAALLVRRITVYQGFRKYVLAGSKPCESADLLGALAEVRCEVGARRPVQLSVNPLVSTPMLLGIVHPHIIIPDGSLRPEDFRYVAMHELVHLRRMDIVYKWLVQIAVCVHWFNPLVYVMDKRISRACELSCDEAVVRRAGPQSAVPYGLTLLNTMATAGTYTEPGGSVNLSENKRVLKERLAAMKKHGKAARGAAALTAAITCVLFIATACSGVYRGALSRIPSRLSAIETLSLEAPDTGGELALDVRQTVVRVMRAENSVPWAEYDPSIFQVSATSTDNRTEISCRTIGYNDGNHCIYLYVPSDVYDFVHFTARNAALRWDGVPASADITGNARESALSLYFPAQYAGAVDITADSSFVMVDAPADFAGTTVSVNLDNNTVFAPNPRIPTGSGVWTYGDGQGRISVDGSDSVICVGKERSREAAYATEDLLEDKAEALADRIEERASQWAERLEQAAEKWGTRAEEWADRIDVLFSAIGKVPAPSAPEAPAAPSAPSAPSAPEVSDPPKPPALSGSEAIGEPSEAQPETTNTGAENTGVSGTLEDDLRGLAADAVSVAGGFLSEVGSLLAEAGSGKEGN